MSKRKRTQFMALEPVSVAMGEAKETDRQMFYICNDERIQRKAEWRR